MIFSDEVFVRIVIFMLGFTGFIVSWHIYKHKKPANTPLVCPMNFDCHAVVHSDYSRFFGVPVEILGMLYYAFLSLSYVALIFVPQIFPVVFVGVLAILSLVAFLFSAYLICVQVFILKKGCFWCFVSALICILIFILTVFTYNLSTVFVNLFA
jgi:uncharacterized membrane protein